MNWIKRYKYYILAFIIPVIGYFSMLYFSNIYFKNDYLPSDAYAQYFPMLQYFKNVLTGTASYPISFSKGLGGTMFGAFFYMLSSPTNLLVVFFKNIKLFIIITILFKMGICGLNSFIYFRKTTSFGNKLLLLFSMLYVFCSYNIMYCFNIMWLDGVMLLPILLLGIEKIIKENKDKLYVCTLFYIIISNYYIGYMLTVFSIIYYIYYTYVNYKKTNYIKDYYKKIFRFTFVTFLTGCMTMFILIPCAIEATNYIRVDQNIKFINFIFFDLYSNTYTGMGNFINPLNFKSILIFFSVSMLPLLVNYFSNKEIRKKEKIATIFILLLFFIPVVLPYLNYLWHLFTYPMAFNYRYSFIATFFLIKICLKSFHNLDIKKSILKNVLIIYFIISLPLTILTYNTMDYYIYLSYINIVVTFILLIVYYGFINNKKVFLKIMCFDMLINIILVIFTTINFVNNPINRDYNYSYFSDKCNLNYRCETLMDGQNRGLLFNYNSVSSFLSSLNYKTIKTIYDFNNESEVLNYVYYDSNQIIIDNLYGIKYLALDKKIRVINFYEKVYEEDDMYFYENKNALSLGYLVNENIKDYRLNSNGVYEQINVVNIMFDRDYKFIDLKYKKINDTTYNLSVDNETKYFYIKTDGILSDKTKGKYAKKDDYFIYYVQDNKDIKLIFNDKPKNIEIFTIDFNKLDNFKEGINQLDIKVNKGNYIKGKIKGQKNKILFTTIPNDKGWKVYIDGKEVKHYEVLNGFIATDIEEGSHMVEFKYKTPGLKVGIVVSLISFITLLIYELKRRKY